MRDLLRGCVWEEDEKIVGCTLVQRRGSTNVWIVGTVGVLPEYPHRGLARKRIERGIQILREQGGEKAILDVIDGNLPAANFMRVLGFEHYSGNIEMQIRPDRVFHDPLVSPRYQVVPLNCFDWQPRFDLEKRIAPENLQKFEPVEERRYRHSPAMRISSHL